MSPSGVSGSITPGVGYLLVGTGGPATYTPSGWACVGAGGVSVPVTGDVVAAPLGASITCTLTFTTATLTLLKHVDGTVPGTIVPGDFTLTAAPAALAGLTSLIFPGSDVPVTSGAGTNTFSVRPAHDYTLTEASELAYLGVELQRYDGPYPVDGVFAEANWVGAHAATVQLPAGAHEVYRFVNAPVPALTLPLTGGIGADAYLFGGLALLVLAGAFVLIRMRPLRRRGAVT